MTVHKNKVGEFVVTFPNKAEEGKHIPVLIINNPMDGSIKFNPITSFFITSPQQFYDYIEDLMIIKQSLQADVPKNKGKEKNA